MRGGGHAVARRVSAVCASVKLVHSFQFPVINVPTLIDKRYTGYPDDRSLMEKSCDEKVIMIGPATLNNEMDIRTAFHMIQKATASFSVIRIISDTTGIQLIVICPLSALS